MRPSWTLASKVTISRSPPLISLPLDRSNCFLCSGQATFGTSPSDAMPCARTNACLCGHMFCVANTDPSLSLKTASCVLPYKTAVPRFGWNASAGPKSCHECSDRSKTLREGGRQFVWASPSAGQSTGRRWPRVSTNSIISSAGWTSSVFANCLKRWANLSGFLTTSAHSSWYVARWCSMRLSSSSQIPRESSMMTSWRAFSLASSVEAKRSNHGAVRSNRSAVRM
mmetsp:Transcript_24239/g.68071  ORF Transcript_24239/g.68071 Transcript_24239/m.68071 type:complete len:226 (-) Transcript_24239:2436-3113(-)